MPPQELLDRHGARWREPNVEDLNHPAFASAAPLGFLCIDVTLRRNSDGVERVHVDDVGFSVDQVGHGVDEALQGALYQWTEGNYGCDCNRRRFFAQTDEEFDAIEDDRCTDSEYTITAPAWLAAEDRP